MKRYDGTETYSHVDNIKYSHIVNIVIKYSVKI